MLGADGSAGASAGEQPGRGFLVTECGVAVAGGDELEDKCGEGIGQDDGLAAEPQTHLVLVGVHVLKGEAADRGGPLGVEENEQSGDTVFGFESVVVEQSAALLPAGIGVDDAGGPVPSGRGEIEISQLVTFGPADEVSGLAPPVAWSMLSQVSRSPCPAFARVRP